MDWRERIFNTSSRQLVLRLAGIAIVLYSVIVLIYANLVPYLGFQFLDGTARRVSVRPVVGNTPAEGDRVISIADVPIDSLPRYVNTLNFLRDRERFPARVVASLDELPGLSAAIAERDSVRYTQVVFQSSGSGSSYSSWFEIHELPWQESAISVGWLAMQSLVFWLCWLVYRKRPEDDATALFFLMCIVTVGAYIGGYHWLRIAGSPALIFVFAVCAMAVPQVSLHFYLLFPTPKRFVLRYPRLLLFGLYGVPSILQVLVLWTIGSVVSTFRQQLDAGDIVRQLSTLRLLVWLHLLLGTFFFAGCIASLIHSYTITAAPLLRAQIRWILAGAIPAGLFVGYAFLFATQDPVSFALGDANWAMLAASAMFSGAYLVSMLRYRLLHVEEILQRGVMYVLFSFAGRLCFSGVLLAAIWFSPYLTSETSVVHTRLAFTALIVLLFGLTTMATRLQQMLDRRFARDTSQLDRAMRRLDEAVGNLADRETVVQRSLVVAREILEVRDAAVYLLADDGRYVLAGRIGHRGFPIHFERNNPLVSRLVNSKSAVEVNVSGMVTRDSISMLFRSLGVELAQPFHSHEQLAGFVLLRSKEDGSYTSAEIGFLSGFAELISMAIHSAHAQETLERLNQELRDKMVRASQHQRQILALQTQAQEQPSSSTPPREASGFAAIHGSSLQVRQLVEIADKAATCQATVLLRGESGTGKGLLAEQIHQRSARRGRPFVAVHCAALSPTLLESELFGHVKGAFTGALRDKTGRFQAADRGTLFLDEIGDISPDVQTKLLRVLQEKTFEPVGSNESIKVDVRVIAATHQPLEQLIAEGGFRADLFYRLNVISILIPPLRERRDDILELAVYFLQQFSTRIGKSLTGFEDEVVEQFLCYDWPGNVRELENVIERAAVMTVGPIIRIEDLAPEVQAHVSSASPLRHGNGNGSGKTDRLSSELSQIERRRLLDALTSSSGNKSEAARLLGMPRSTFCSKLHKLGIA